MSYIRFQLVLSAVLLPAALYSQMTTTQSYDSIAVGLFETALRSGQAYETLHELTSTIGNRLGGSPKAEQAVAWTERKMKEFGFENVRREPVNVPQWERGAKEQVDVVLQDGSRTSLNAIALGGSVGTPADGITSEVIEVRSLAEIAALGLRAKGRIIFCNRPLDPSKIDAFEAYSGAVDQRLFGAIEAGRVNASAVLVRSMAPQIDDVPHTGIMLYNDSIPRIPGVAISTEAADRLSALLKQQPRLKVFLKTSSRILPDVESANIIGELTGTTHPNEVVVIGGHIDSWDVGQGAHDDGAGVVHAMEALRLLKERGLRPKRTIRVVAFMSEETGLWGGRAYADKKRNGERCIAAIESDKGGFMPRGFTTDARGRVFSSIKKWEYLFRPIRADRIVQGDGGPDISFLAEQGVPLIGLDPESARYFNYHHTSEDTFDKVNERELELGAASMAVLAYVLAQEGL